MLWTVTTGLLGFSYSTPRCAPLDPTHNKRGK